MISAHDLFVVFPRDSLVITTVKVEKNHVRASVKEEQDVKQFGTAESADRRRCGHG